MKLTINTTRLLVALPSIGACFGIIFVDILTTADVDKAIYAAIGTWMGLMLNFFFRKAGTEVSADKK